CVAFFCCFFGEQGSKPPPLSSLPLSLFSQELNVRQLTLSTDKDKYGISLRAEPDHMVLGKRLKGAFKSITASIKELKSEQLETFQKTGSIVVDGQELHEEDLRLMYSFNQTSGSATQYEAHSDSQVVEAGGGVGGETFGRMCSFGTAGINRTISNACKCF
ncbi:unnamed protein product, partial [Oncorhynchus mykiss]